MKRKFTVGIIGLGKIAQGFDTPDGKSTLTHIKAYQNDPEIEIRGIFDSDFKKMNEVGLKWNIPATFNSLQDFLSTQYDVISICTPDEVRRNVIEPVITAKPQVLFCEKPLAVDYREAEWIVNSCSRKRIKLIVNYSRLWWDDIHKIRDDYRSGKYGEIISINSKYPDGFLKNGSHIISIIEFCFGLKEIISGKITTQRKTGIATDPGITGIFICKNSNQQFSLTLESYPLKNFSLFELDIIFSKHRIRLTEGNEVCLSDFALTPCKFFPEFMGLDMIEKKELTFHGLLAKTISHIKRTIITGRDRLNSGYNALKTLYLCEQIKKTNL